MTTLPKLEDYKAPWELDSTGADLPEEDQKIDPARLKKYLHGLLSDKERLQTTVTTVTGERDALQKTVDDKAREGEDDAARKQREAQEAIDAAKAEGGLGALKLDVALDVEGITPKQARTLAKSLSGQTREELEAHAKELSEAFGIGGPAGDEEEHEEEHGQTAARRPRVPRASGDPKPNERKLPDPNDPAAVLAAFPLR